MKSKMLLLRDFFNAGGDVKMVPSHTQFVGPKEKLFVDTRFFQIFIDLYKC